MASFEFIPAWAISFVCLGLILISLFLEALLHFLTRFLTKRKRKSLVKAMEKTQAELMTMGLISLLLTISEVPISKICVSEGLANSFLPCKHPFLKDVSLSTHISALSADIKGLYYCQAKGMISLISREGVVQLKIFIFVLAVFHVFYCILTMFLGMAKIRRWKTWEEETKSIAYQIANDPRRFRLSHQTSFGKRNLNVWSQHPLLFWPICFVRQFSHSATKADYFTIRNGFILANAAEGSTFNFQKFIVRAFDDDFEQIVGIRLWIWMLCLLFIFFSAQEFCNYYWLPFIPLVLVLMVGTKLETIITKMCEETCKHSSVIRGAFVVKPGSEFFWFNKPKLLLFLIQFILIQNSFQLAFFTWTWYQYGLRSCFNQETEDVVIRISTGICVQFLCGYVTLPIYALVTQMGSGKKKAVFTEQVAKGLKNWHSKAREHISRNLSNDNAISLAVMSPFNSEIKEINDAEHQDTSPPRADEPSTSTSDFNSLERNDDDDEDDSNDEISFASSWKKIDNGSSGSAEFCSIMEDDDGDDNFDDF